MQGPNIDLAEEWAAAALARYSLVPPIDLDVIRRGLHLYSRRKAMPDEDSGCLIHTAHRVYIVLNASHSPERQRFSTAHEIAEFLLQRHRERTGKVLAQGHPKERFCDRFASCLLMPENAVREAAERIFHDRRRNNKCGALARMFGVSTSAMAIRLRELGIDVHLTRHERAALMKPTEEFRARMDSFAAEMVEFVGELKGNSKG